MKDRTMMEKLEIDAQVEVGLEWVGNFVATKRPNLVLNAIK